MMVSFCWLKSALNVSAGEGATNVSWSGEAESHRQHTRIISTLLILTSVVGAPLNGLALWVLGFRVRRKNRFVVYVVNLLASDFLFLFFQAVHSVCRFAGVGGASRFLLSFRCVIVACNEASAYLLTWISVERFLGVAFPIWWRVSRTKDSAVLASWLIWGLSIGLATLYGVIRATDIQPAAKEGLVAMEFALAFLAPFLVFTLANVLILCGSKRSSRKTTKLYRAITLNAVIFLMCWVPYHTCVFLHYQALSARRPALCVSAYYGAYYSVCLLHIKSCVIPLIYISISNELKVKFRESLPSIFERRFSEESGLSSPVPDNEATVRSERNSAQK
ncbi:mas-related G-protein coupled receptor member A6-like [Carcharodon carcharias]|uniref:mas-related G-protein coupled receptor member A6-like n=1 Tax=Carcharodon carcharias TaxID=13397 RepID=UPI001B7E4A85|nr:mas-related G-protein coupled receptor member A6-like [Carcharodon carcharias]